MRATHRCGKRPVKRRVSFLLRLMIVPIHQVDWSSGSWMGTLASRNPVSNRWARRGTLRRHEPSGLQAAKILMMSPRRRISSFFDPSPLVGEAEEEEMSSGSNGMPAVDVVEELLFSSSHVPNSSNLPSTATTVKVEPRLFRWKGLDAICRVFYRSKLSIYSRIGERNWSGFRFQEDERWGVLKPACTIKVNQHQITSCTFSPLTLCPPCPPLSHGSPLTGGRGKKDGPIPPKTNESEMP